MNRCILSEVSLLFPALFHISCITNARIAGVNWAETKESIASIAARDWSDRSDLSDRTLFLFAEGTSGCFSCFVVVYDSFI